MGRKQIRIQRQVRTAREDIEEARYLLVEAAELLADADTIRVSSWQLESYARGCRAVEKRIARAQEEFQHKGIGK